MAGEKEYIGTVRKCPNCGKELESFQARCPSCGHEISNVLVNAMIINFAWEFFQTISHGRLEDKTETSGQMDEHSIASIFVPYNTVAAVLGPDKIHKNISQRRDGEWLSRDEWAKELVDNFPIPNSREDLLELFIFAYGHVYPNPFNNYYRKWNAIWGTKLKQIFAKAQISMNSESDTLDFMRQLLKEASVI